MCLERAFHGGLRQHEQSTAVNPTPVASPANDLRSASARLQKSSPTVRLRTPFLSQRPLPSPSMLQWEAATGHGNAQSCLTRFVTLAAMTPREPVLRRESLNRSASRNP